MEAQRATKVGWNLGYNLCNACVNAGHMHVRRDACVNKQGRFYVPQSNKNYERKLVLSVAQDTVRHFT